MNNNLNNLHEILQTWGHKQRQLPLNNQPLKVQILSKYSTEPQALPRRMPWFALALAGLAVFTFLIQSVGVSNKFDRSSNTFSQAPDSSGDANLTVPQSQSGSLEQSYPYPNNNVPVSDSREFLKKDYNATMRTRKVLELTERIQTVVRGFGGRVDGSNSSDGFGYVSFVVPATKFDTFRSEIRSLGPNKLYIEQTSVQNLLPQKQSIEQAQTEAEKTLSQLQADRQQLVVSHKTTINSLQLRINNINKELAGLDPQNESRRQELTNQKNSLQTQLNNENKSYQNKLSSLDEQIRYAESNLENIKTQDQNLLDNVATVQGTISLNRISIWQMVDLYVPGALLAWLFLAAALASYYWRRYREVYI